MTWIAGVGVIALTLWAYASVWSAGWVHEDLASVLYGSGAVGRPFTTWTWQIVQTPLSSHALNLMLHLGLAGLVTAFARRLGCRGLGLWAVGGIWLVHPMNAELVAYAASRGELLAALGVVLACFITAGAWWTWQGLGLVGGIALALASKESGAVVLLLVPLTAIWMHAGWRRWVPVSVSLWTLSLGVLAVGGLRSVINLGGTTFVSATDIAWTSWVGLQAAAAHHWIGSAIWLTGFTPDLDVDAVPLLARGLSIAVLVGMGLSAIWWRQSRLVSFGLAWTLVALVPRLIVQTPQSYLNMHQFAVPALGLVLLAGMAAMWGEDRWARMCDARGW